MVSSLDRKCPSLKCIHVVHSVIIFGRTRGAQTIIIMTRRHSCSSCICAKPMSCRSQSRLWEDLVKVFLAPALPRTVNFQFQSSLIKQQGFGSAFNIRIEAINLAADELHWPKWEEFSLHNHRLSTNEVIER